MIFVSVAAFCDPFLEHTLSDAIAKANDPENLVFAVVDQTPENRKDQLRLICGKAQLRYVHISPIETRGVCWARSLVFSMYQGESFVLQIDSHMFFEEKWDQQIINQWLTLKQISHKPIISTYPYGFEFEDDKPVVKITVSPKTTLVLRPHQDRSVEHGACLSRKCLSGQLGANQSAALQPGGLEAFGGGS